MNIILEAMNSTTVLPHATVAYEMSKNFRQNVHDPQTEALQRGMLIVSMVIYSLAFVLGVIGNGLVIFITGFRMKRTVNTVWFLHLAIADFAFTLFLPLSVAYAALGFHWPFGRAMCKINSALAFLNLYASVYLLMVISIDRCLSVRFPVWSHNHRTPRLASFVVLGVWILALVLSCPNLYFRDTELNKKNMRICFNNYGNTDKEKYLKHRAMIISRFIFGFVIPFSIIVFCYGAIVLKLRRNELTQSNKPFKVITAVIVAFFACWLPHHIFSFIELQLNKQPELHVVVLIGVPLASSLAFVNSCLNPILFVFMGHNFKERLRHSLFSAFENAFIEDGRQNTTYTKARPSVELQLLS
ncbi:chemerin-like receptor 1 [Hemicordylus capensis]|uniref:chemerin-like receptor 1 n=1 Tax=Hemicordylus capensis TaxID=884348 RepID=UPI0023020ECC|nr:chemerin-like receptor 1 [Hemicordylus capensis]XP_053123443.1 chemerin-like receptor 1 [Hemicordylus capensis]